MDQENNKESKLPKIAVVLGSGGMRSLSGLPILEYLTKHKIPIDLIVGSGGGAVLGALFAAGYSLEEIPLLMGHIFKRENYEHLDYSELLKIVGFRRKKFESPPAPYKSKPLKECFREIFKDKKLEALPYRMVIQTTDMDTGSSVRLRSGDLADCLYATNVIYPFFPPLGLNGQWLVGGVYTAAMPILTAVDEQMDIILALGVNNDMEINATSLSEYMNTFFVRSCSSSQKRLITLAISMHHGETVMINVNFEKSVNIWDIDEISDILDAGRQALENRKLEFDDLFSKFKTSF